MGMEKAIASGKENIEKNIMEQKLFVKVAGMVVLANGVEEIGCIKI